VKIRSIILVRLARAVFVTLAGGLHLAHANLIAQLPVQPTATKPALLLELGDRSLAAGENNASQVFKGEISSHEGDTAIQLGKDDISSLHPGFGNWKVGFRFKIKPGSSAGYYTFWARWRQGGDPNVCVQTFEVWAGPDPVRLEKRATLSMKPKGWEYAWITADSMVNLKADDTVVEIRNAGAGHDAKVFNAFLLAPPVSTLPVSPTLEAPLLLLELGKAPVLAALEKMSLCK